MDGFECGDIVCATGAKPDHLILSGGNLTALSLKTREINNIWSVF